MTNTVATALNSPTVSQVSTTSHTFPWTAKNASGNVAIFVISLNATSTNTITSITAPGYTFSQLGTVLSDGTNSVVFYMFAAFPTTVTLTTITIVTNAAVTTANVGIDALEIRSDLTGATWAAVNGAQIGPVSSNSLAWGAITCNAGDFYYGDSLRAAGTLTAGSTTGFTYDTATGTCFDLNTVSGSISTSMAISTSTSHDTIAGVVRPTAAPTAGRPIPFISGYSGMFYHEENNAYRTRACDRPASQRRLSRPDLVRARCGLRSFDRSGLRWGERRGGVRIG